MEKTIFKRKYRWLIETKKDGEILTQNFCRVSARPSPSFLRRGGVEDFPLFYEDINFTFYNCFDEQKDEFLTAFEKMDETVVKLVDGCGGLLEEWNLLNVKLVSINENHYYHYCPYDNDIEVFMQYKECEWTQHQELPSLPTAK